MAWLALIFSAVCEAIWATSLGHSNGLSQPVPTVIFVVALLASSIGLAVAVTSIPIGTAYASWAGLGAALTVGWAIVIGDESASVAKVVFLSGIIVAVVGLKFISPAAPSTLPVRPADIVDDQDRRSRVPGGAAPGAVRPRAQGDHPSDC